MKKRVQHLLQAIGFTVALAAAILACSEFFEYKEATEKYTDFYEAETNFDVILLGTSHTYGSILPMELWREYGITSYNWGYKNCAVPESYYMMVEALKRTQPKLFIVDLYTLLEYDNWDGSGNGKYRTDKVEQQHVQFDDMPFSREKVAAVRDIFDDYDKNNDFLWNFILYHNRWEELGEWDFTAQGLPLMGATLYDAVGTMPSYLPTETGTMELDHLVGYQYMLKMMELCEENDVQVLFTYLPFPAKADAQQVANSLGEAIKGHPNAAYLNMLGADYLVYPADIYRDNHHLNYMGSRKVTSWLGNYITEHYDIESHFDDPATAAYWDEYYQHYTDYKRNMLAEQTNLYSQLLLLYRADLQAELQVATDRTAFARDAVAASILGQLTENVTVTETEHLVYEGQPCDLLLTVRRADTGELLQQGRFSYRDGVPTLVEPSQS